MPTLSNALWASKETEALDLILAELPGLERDGDARLDAESPTKVDFWIRLCQDALDGTAEFRIICNMQDRAPEFLREMFRRRIREYIWLGTDGNWRAEDAEERKWIWNTSDKKWVPDTGAREQDGA
jgi:hypothetical protein